MVLEGERGNWKVSYRLDEAEDEELTREAAAAFRDRQGTECWVSRDTGPQFHLATIRPAGEKCLQTLECNESGGLTRNKKMVQIPLKLDTCCSAFPSQFLLGWT